MDTAECDQRDEHQCVPPRPVTLKELNEKTGVEYFEVSTERGACVAVFVKFR